VNPEGVTRSQIPSRGYKGLSEEKVWKKSSETAGLSDARELREYFDMGPPADYSFPTPWPEDSDLPGFQQYLESQYEAFQKLGLQLMRALEMGMQVPEGTFTERCVPDASELRFNHYPAVTRQELDVGNTRRIWPHTDIGLFSFVFQGNDRGLQVEDRKSPGKFVTLQQQESVDEMIFNVADTLERWTNGNLRACVHQVAVLEGRKAKSVPSRRSIVFFFKARGDVTAGPLPQFVSASQPAKYDEIMVSEYHDRQNTILYS